MVVQDGGDRSFVLSTQVFNDRIDTEEVCEGDRYRTVRAIDRDAVGIIGYAGEKLIRDEWPQPASDLCIPQHITDHFFCPPACIRGVELFILGAFGVNFHCVMQIF